MGSLTGAQDKKVRSRTRLIDTLLRLFWQAAGREDYIARVTRAVRDWSGCECVGLRALDEHENIPYASHVGFDPHFIQSESSLSIRRDTCACVRVIANRPEPQDSSAMTPAGSFWCGDTAAFVRRLSEAERSRFRGVCVKEGFKTIAIVPIRHEEKTLGAIHLADHRKSALSRANIRALETAAPLIGQGIYRFYMEERLRKSESSLLRAQQVAHVGNWDWELSEDRLYWSDEVYRIFGLSPQDFEASHEGFLHHVHRDDRVRVQRAVDSALYEGKDYSIDHRIVRPDGSERFVHEEGEVTFDEAGKPVRMMGTVHDTTDLRLAEAELRALSRRLVRAQDGERWAIARELHDQTGQSLTMLKLQLDRARGLPEDTETLLDQAANTVSGLLEDVRHLSLTLRPAMLDDLGLLHTLLWYVDDFTARTGVNVSLSHSGLDRELPTEIAMAAYRVVQEALTNVLRHAQADQAEVRAWVDSGRLRLEIRDHGVGFDMGHVSAMSSGLRGMRDRTYALDGDFEVQSRPGSGTVVSAEWPIS
ncbi:MAG: PAS domain-containing protein [Chloroflexota bacterium]